MAGSAGLSALPDDLLRRVLYFTPAKEAASTAVLSRRWRSLWRTSGALNLDSRSNDRAHGGDVDPSWQVKAQAFARGMEAALAAAGTTIKRLTLHVEEPCFEYHFIMSTFDCDEHHRDMIAAMLASAAARAAEELRVVIAARRDATHLNFSHLSFGSLPSETLRTLRVTGCNALTTTTPPPGGAVFPRLAELRLRRCGVSIADLQRIVDAAPQLATLHLESYAFRGHGETTWPDGVQSYRLLCRPATAVVLEDCSWPWKDEGRLELDMPRLQYFRYKGHVQLCQRLSLKQSASHNKIRVDLRIGDNSYRHEQIQVPFWEFLRNFSIAKALKLKLEDFETHHVAVDDDKDDDHQDSNNLLLISNRLFCNLERLELELPSSEPASKSPALFIANLLHCCPVVRELHLKVMITKASKTNTKGRIQCRSDFDESIDRFRNYKRRPKSLLNVAVSYGGAKLLWSPASQILR